MHASHGTQVTLRHLNHLILTIAEVDVLPHCYTLERVAVRAPLAPVAANFALGYSGRSAPRRAGRPSRRSCPDACQHFREACDTRNEPACVKAFLTREAEELAKNFEPEPANLKVCTRSSGHSSSRILCRSNGTAPGEPRARVGWGLPIRSLGV